MKKLFVLLGASMVLFACNNSSSTSSNNNKEESAATSPSDSLTNSSGQSAAGSKYEKGAELIASNDCLTCHKINEKVVGPAYMDVSKKYDATEANIENLANKVIKGGSGTWGTTPMTPHPNLSVDDAKTMVEYILSLKNEQ